MLYTSSYSATLCSTNFCFDQIIDIVFIIDNIQIQLKMYNTQHAKQFKNFYLFIFNSIVDI